MDSLLHLSVTPIPALLLPPPQAVFSSWLPSYLITYGLMAVSLGQVLLILQVKSMWFTSGKATPLVVPIDRQAEQVKKFGKRGEASIKAMGTAAMQQSLRRPSNASSTATITRTAAGPTHTASSGSLPRGNNNRIAQRPSLGRKISSNSTLYNPPSSSSLDRSRQQQQQPQGSYRSNSRSLDRQRGNNSRSLDRGSNSSSRNNRSMERGGQPQTGGRPLPKRAATTNSPQQQQQSRGRRPSVQQEQQQQRRRSASIDSLDPDSYLRAHNRSNNEMAGPSSNIMVPSRQSSIYKPSNAVSDGSNNFQQKENIIIPSNKSMPRDQGRRLLQLRENTPPTISSGRPSPSPRDDDRKRAPGMLEILKRRNANDRSLESGFDEPQNSASIVDLFRNSFQLGSARNEEDLLDDIYGGHFDYNDL